jgi:hypothetical protein
MQSTKFAVFAILRYERTIEFKISSTNFQEAIMRRLGSILLACAVLGGCSHGIQIEEHAIDYNLAAEGAENEMLLLNIVRASKGLPMHFTRIINVNGNLTSQFDANISTGFGVAATTKAETNPKVTLKSNPTYNVRFLNTQEFFNAFLKPISPDTFRLFMEQGWTVDLLAHALIEEIQIYSPRADSFTCRVEGNPDSRAELQPRSMAALGRFIDKFGEFRVVSLNTEVFGPADVTDLKTFTEALSALPAGFQISRKDGPKPKYVISEPARDFSVLIVSSGLSEEDTENAKISPKDRVPECSKEYVAKLEAALDPNQPSAEKDREYAARITLRSASGMFNALGEMAKISLKEPERAKKLGFFKLEKGDVAPLNAISTVYKGTAYWIPEGDERSFRFLWLAQEILSLNVSSEDDPARTTFLLQ